jgi:hypothetical protein
VVALIALPEPTLANGAAYRLVDEDGVIRITNAPADPRFEKLPGYTGSTLGLLRVPEGPKGRWAADIREIATTPSIPRWSRRSSGSSRPATRWRSPARVPRA